jgi:glycosyltransferase involved in cell wall biosynthesis
MVMTTIPETMAGFLSRQLTLLAEDGFEIHTVCSPGAGIEKLQQLPGVTAHGVPMERKPDPRRDVVSFLRLVRLMRRIRPDVVHAHTPKAGLLGMAAAKVAGVPVRLYTIHGLPLLTRSGKWRRVLEFAEQASCGLATQVYSVSPSIQDVATDMRLCPADKVSTLGDGSCAGINLDRFDASADLTDRAAAVRRAYGIPDGALLLTFVGRIARDKGIAILASAWKELAERFPNLHLLLVGIEDTSDPVSAPILQELRNNDRVHFTDSWIQDVPAVYANTSIAVLPTYREGLPQMALEAGAMGVPMVSTRVPGVVNSVQDGVTGQLVPAGEVAPLTEAIQRLIESPALRTALGTAARQHISSHFSEQRVNQLWLSEYRKLIRKSLPTFADRVAPATSEITK